MAQKNPLGVAFGRPQFDIVGEKGDRGRQNIDRLGPSPELS
jgi:hypothetical protein